MYKIYKKYIYNIYKSYYTCPQALTDSNWSPTKWATDPTMLITSLWDSKVVRRTCMMWYITKNKEFVAFCLAAHLCFKHTGWKEIEINVLSECMLLLIMLWDENHIFCRLYIIISITVIGRFKWVIIFCLSRLRNVFSKWFDFYLKHCNNKDGNLINLLSFC